MTETPDAVISSFGSTNLGRQRRTTKPRPTDFFALQYAPVEAAPDVIRKNMKSFMKGLSIQDPTSCLTYDQSPTQVFDWATVSAPTFFSWQATLRPTFEKLETAIGESKRLLAIEVAPDEGVDVGYSENTWSRAITLLRSLAEIFWDDHGAFLPVPSIGPADAGSIDLFWEIENLTLLINIPADIADRVTFYGRRLDVSKISGVLGGKDAQPRHLTGWLASR